MTKGKVFHMSDAGMLKRSRRPLVCGHFAQEAMIIFGLQTAIYYGKIRVPNNLFSLILSPIRSRVFCDRQ